MSDACIKSQSFGSLATNKTSMEVSLLKYIREFPQTSGPKNAKIDRQILLSLLLGPQDSGSRV